VSDLLLGVGGFGGTVRVSEMEEDGNCVMCVGEVMEDGEGREEGMEEGIEGGFW
jgi:hypothetical protein